MVITCCPVDALNSQNVADIIKDMNINMNYLLAASIGDAWERKQKR